MDQHIGRELAEYGFERDPGNGVLDRKREGISDRFQLVYIERGAGYRIQPNAGVRHEQVEALFHKLSGFERQYQAGTVTMGLPLGVLVSGTARGCEFALESRAEIPGVAALVLRAFHELALPYFANWSSLERIDAELNADPTRRSIHRSLAWFRCSTGLIVAKLVRRANYEELRAVYVGIMDRDNKGFYAKRFRDLVALLDTVSPGEASTTPDGSAPSGTRPPP